MCPECHSLDFAWAPMSGRGTVYTYAIVNQPLHPFWSGRTPYNVVLVELEEGVRIVSNLVDCPNDLVRIGMPVTVVWEDVTDEISLPMFKPREGVMPLRGVRVVALGGGAACAFAGRWLAALGADVHTRARSEREPLRDLLAAATW
jgi:hypothetical protein